MLNQQSDSGPRGDEARMSGPYADTAQSIRHLRMPASRQRRDAENPLRPGPETSYLQAGELGRKITKDDADCWPCRRLDWRQSGSVPGVNILTTIGIILAELKNPNGIDFLFLIDFMADLSRQSGKCNPRTNKIIRGTFPPPRAVVLGVARFRVSLDCCW